MSALPNGKPTTAERLGVIENTLKYVQQGVDNINATINGWGEEKERIIGEASKVHQELQKQINGQVKRCEEVQIRKESGLSGKDKALILAAVASGVFALAATMVQVFW